MSGRFRPSDRLRDGRDFRRVSRVAQRAAGPAFVMLLAPPGPDARPDGRRLGVSVSRRVGNAVVRNRVKRGIREWFRTRRGDWPEGIDLVVIARRPAAALGGVEIAAALDAIGARLRRRAASAAPATPRDPGSERRR